MTSIDTTPIRRRKAGVKGQKKEKLKIDMTPIEFANLQICKSADVRIANVRI